MLRVVERLRVLGQIRQRFDERDYIQRIKSDCPSVKRLLFSVCVCLGIADGMSIALWWMCRYSK